MDAMDGSSPLVEAPAFLNSDEEEVDMASADASPRLPSGLVILRRATVGAVGFLGLLAVVVLSVKRATGGGCVSRFDPEGMVSLVEASHGDMKVTMEEDDDPEVVARWLADEAEKHKEYNPEHDKKKLIAAMEKDAKAPDEKTTQEIEQMVTEMTIKNLVTTSQKRQDLQSAINKARLDSKTTEHTNKLKKIAKDAQKAKEAKADHDEDHHGENATRGQFWPRWPEMPNWGGPYVADTEYNFTRRIVQQHYVAFCTFNILNMISHIARLGLDLNDAVETCPAARYSKTSDAACFINVGSALTSLSWVASLLSFAADECAATIIPNIDANCAGGVTAMVGLISQLSTGAALAAESCTSRGVFVRQPRYVKASHVGKIIEQERRLSTRADKALIMEMMQNKSMPGRRLLLGGGVGSDYTACTVDITEVAWWLATFALFVNGAANPKTYGSCARRSFLGEPLAGFCIVDIAGAVFAFEQAAAMIQLTIVHCSNELDLPSLCGAGITEIMSSISGIVASGTGIALACGKYQSKKGTVNFARRFDDFTGGLITRGVGTVLDVYGRRLGATKSTAEFEARVEQVKKAFRSPKEVFKHLGFDSEDSEWRKSVDSSFRDPIEFLQVPETSDGHVAGLPQEQVCKATPRGV